MPPGLAPVEPPLVGASHVAGYPFQLLLWATAGLPGASLAYRLHVLSGLLGSVTVAVVFLILRQLECSRAAAVAGALALGLGTSFWSQSTSAGVDTLVAALLAATVLGLLRWSDGPADRPLPWRLGAIAFALAVATSLPTLALLPAIVLYGSRIGPRQVRQRALVFTLLLTVVALTPHLYLPAADPTSIDPTAAPPSLARTVLSPRTPRAAAGLPGAPDLANRALAVVGGLRAELSHLGVVFLVIGGVRLFVRSRWRATFLAAGGLTTTVIAIASVPVDVRHAIVPTIVLAWLFTGVGIAWLLETRTTTTTWVGALALVAVLPASQLLGGYRTHDHFFDNWQARYFDALSTVAGDRAAVISEDAVVDESVRLGLQLEAAREGRRIVSIPRDADTVAAYRDQGYEVFGFGQGRAELELGGLRFRRVGLLDETLPRYLARLPRGLVVAVAATDGSLAELRERGPTLEAIGGRARLYGHPQWAYAAVGVVGSTGANAERIGSGAVALRADPGEEIGETGSRAPVFVRTAVSGSKATIWVDGREVVRVEGGVAIAILEPDGTPVETHALRHRAMRVPFDRESWRVSRLIAWEPCVALGESWSEVGGGRDDGSNRGLDRPRSGERSARRVCVEGPPSRPQDLGSGPGP